MWVWKHFSCVYLFVTPWTVAHQAPLSKGFPRRILEWVAMPFSRGLSWSRDWTQVSCIAGRFFTTEPPEKPLYIIEAQFNFIRVNYFGRQAMFCQNLSPPPSRYSSRLYCPAPLAVWHGLDTYFWRIKCEQRGYLLPLVLAVKTSPTVPHMLFFPGCPMDALFFPLAITWIHITKGGNSIFLKSTKEINMFSL